MNCSRGIDRLSVPGGRRKAESEAPSLSQPGRIPQAGSFPPPDPVFDGCMMMASRFL
jgi:hypothetical protein